MALFSKAPRFPPVKPSEVPGPGAYNPLLPDPSRDTWRKGAMELEKAPRSKAPDPGPDTFGLYNPSNENHNYSKKPLTATELNKSTKTTSETARLEVKYAKLQEREKVQATQLLEAKSKLASLLGLQQKLELLGTEHAKSKTKRDVEVATLKQEGRQLRDEITTKDARLKELEAENREANITIQQLEEVNRTRISESDERQNAVEYLEADLNAARHAFESLAQNASQAYSHLWRTHQDVLSRIKTPDLEKTELEIALTSKAVKVKEFSLLARELEEKLDITDRDGKRWKKEAAAAWQEARHWATDARRQRQQMQAEIETLTQQSLHYSSLLNIETGLVSLLITVYLNSTCETKNDEVAGDNQEFQEATEMLRILSATLPALRESLALETANRQSAEQTASKAVKDLAKETVSKKEVVNTLSLQRQGQMALATTLITAEANLARLDGLASELVAVQRDLVEQTVLSRLEREQADKLAEYNDDLVSQGNPGQKVKVLDRWRQQGREDRDNIAKLQATVVDRTKRIKALEEELNAYRPCNDHYSNCKDGSSPHESTQPGSFALSVWKQTISQQQQSSSLPVTCSNSLQTDLETKHQVKLTPPNLPVVLETPLISIPSMIQQSRLPTRSKVVLSKSSKMYQSSKVTESVKETPIIVGAVRQVGPMTIDELI